VFSGSVPTQSLALAYNADGDRTGVTSTVGGVMTATATSYVYDQADHLISATIGLTTSSYAYNGDGLRLRKTVNGVTNTYTWDESGQLPALLQENGTRYIYGPDGQPIEQVTGAGTALYYYQDQLGSTRELADCSGRIAATYRYDAYGNPLAKTGSASTPFGYAGEYTDAETGLQYLRARYYDPATSQFLTRDPLVAETGQPYAYAAADPLNSTDPSGLCPDFDPLCWVGTALHTGYEFTTATGGSFAGTIRTGAVGTYYSLAEAARLLPVTGPFLDGGVRPYLLHVSGDLSDAAVTANHLDIAWGLVSQSVAAPFKAALACPNATTIGTAAGDTLGNLALLLGPSKAAGFVRGVLVATSTERVLTNLATRAAGNVPRGTLSATVWGTLVHSEFHRLIEALNRADIRTEVRYLNGVEQTGRRVSGEVRLDVAVYDRNGNITAVYDLKTGVAGLTPARITQILSHLPAGSGGSAVIEIRPS